MTEETIFAAALEMPSAARADYLAKSCGDDKALRKRLEGLLAASDKAGNFMIRPAVDAHSPGAATELYESDEATAQRKRQAEEAEELAEAEALLTPSQRPDSLGRIGHYEVLQVLGKGGFGIVFRAFDDILQRVVAVKVMAPQMAATSPARKRFLREARTSAAVRHENVVQVYEVAEQPLPYLVMEFIPGETLQQRLDRNGPLDAPEIVRIGRQIAEGLAAAHATDLIHRDIKPGNILLEGGALKVKITDFGLARAADDASISQSGIIAGTPMFMAPEQALGHALDQRADLFSLGSVLYQMATGRPPFRANGTLAVLKRVAEDTPRPIREVIPETPQWLCDIISKLHAKKPDERFQSAREVADVLVDCEGQLKAHAKLKDYSRIPRSKQPAAAKSGRWKRVVAAVLLFPVIALAATEFTGVTQLFRKRQAATDPIKPGGEAQLAVASIGWGKFEDPDRDCVFTEENGELAITVPGTDHDLSIERGKMNSPRAMQPVDGDFTVQVKVTGEFEPGQQSVAKGRKAYLGAGLFLRNDDNNYITLDRGTISEGTINFAYANFEMRVSGLIERFGKTSDLPIENPQNTWLKIERKGNKFSAYATQEAGKWQLLGTRTIDAPKRIHLGVAAKNTSLKPFTPRFSDFSLKSEPLQPETTGPTLPPPFKNSIGMEFVIVPKGKSWLGGGKDKLGDQEVEIPADFYLGKYEVTQEEWEKVMGENPSRFSREGGGADAVKEINDADLKRYPVEEVSWHQCELFAEKLNRIEKEKGWVYRLPTEVEWEYACRGGPMSDKLISAFDFYFGKPTNTLFPDHANFGNSGPKRTCKVASFEPNALGLHDMHGNVWEWCSDSVKGADGAAHRVLRGGDWYLDSGYCRAASRITHPPSHRVSGIGLRLARVPAGAPSTEAKAPATGMPFTDADVKRIAALPAAEQVEEVRKELMKRNPGFDSTFTPTIKEGAITELKLITDEIVDISPVRALQRLVSLDLSPTSGPGKRGKLSDISPLRGLPLTHLNLGCIAVTDITVLKEMPLKELSLDRAPVTDLSPLTGKVLKSLHIGGTKVKSLSDVPIAGSEVIHCHLPQITDKAELQRLGVRFLDLWGVPATVDPERLRELKPPLSRVNGKPLEEFLREQAENR